ncbi:MAG: FecR domain-containing protein [Acidobacteria bacterium]|nr:FecR domain-containing protein [Acidobacteriota bacterium]
MRLAQSLVIASVAAVSLAGGAFAQNAISAKAGMINVAEGDIFLVDAKGVESPVQPKPSEFIDIKEGQTLKTTEGRVEVLLTPGAFLRMADNSSFKLFSNRLSDVRLDVQSGVVMVEAAELLEDNHLTVLTKDAVVTVTKAGLYRFEAEPASIRVYMGELVVDQNGQKTTLKGGRELVATAGGWTPGKFDAKDTDPLFRWSKRRSGYIAMANVSAARQSTPRNGFLGSGSWMYNPYFGFATFIPYADTLRSPFGFYYYTPSTVMAVYYPPVYASGGGSGYGGRSGNGFTASMPGRSASGSSYTAAPMVSSPGAIASSSGISRASGGMGSVGGGGGSVGGGGGASVASPAGAAGGGGRGGSGGRGN